MIRFGVRVGLHLAGAGAVLCAGLAIMLGTYEYRPDHGPSNPCPRLTWDERVADMEAGIPNFPRICPERRGSLGNTTSGYRAGGGPIWTPSVQEW